MRNKNTNILEYKKEDKYIKSLFKGVVLALLVSMFCILIFAFFLRFTNLSDRYIAPINEIIKGISIFLGVFVGLKKQRHQGLLGGLIIGLLFTIIAFILFSILDGGINLSRTFVNDLIFGSIIGAICGVICVNLKKNSI